MHEFDNQTSGLFAEPKPSSRNDHADTSYTPRQRAMITRYKRDVVDWETVTSLKFEADDAELLEIASFDSGLKALTRWLLGARKQMGFYLGPIQTTTPATQGTVICPK